MKQDLSGKFGAVSKNPVEPSSTKPGNSRELVKGQEENYQNQFNKKMMGSESAIDYSKLVGELEKRHQQEEYLENKKIRKTGYQD